MSGPVDVLAVLDAAVMVQDHSEKAVAADGDIDAARRAFARIAKRLEQASSARAAVAELIEAGNAWCDLMPGLAGGSEFDRLTNALARVGGAS